MSALALNSLMQKVWAQVHFKLLHTPTEKADLVCWGSMS